MEIVKSFLQKWHKYFGNSELPTTFHYSDKPREAEYAGVPPRWRCFICDLRKVRRGRSLYFDSDSLTCTGGKRYLGFSHKLRDNFEYFLSYGIEGELEGERYKKSPEIVKEQLKQQPPLTAPARYAVFKRIDKLNENDSPSVAIFFATADVLSGIFTLANYDETDRNGVIAPFGAGCSSITYYPYKELESERPRAILGMFDVSARPCVMPGILTLSVPWPKFKRMVNNMDESFLITDSWKKIGRRITKKNNTA
jgi:uncharacterized protein (DUF169 family)